MGQLKKVLIGDIHENPVALRAVNRDSEDYKGLCESIRNKGFLGAILVRERQELDPKTQQPTGNIFYELVDGLHRFTASKDVGLTEINVDVVDLNEDEMLEAQLMANIHNIETTPVQYTGQLRRILARNPTMTESALATKLGKSPAWIADRLSLTKIDNPTIKALIDEGKINLTNAYGLAKLPPNEQTDWVERAMTKSPTEFLPEVLARVKAVKEAKRQGREAAPAEFIPTAHLQKLSDIKAQADDPVAIKQLISDLGISDPVEAAKMTLKWALHLDPQSVAAAKAKADAEKAERAEAAKRRAAERDAKKAEEAKKKAEEAAKVTIDSL